MQLFFFSFFECLQKSKEKLKHSLEDWKRLHRWCFPSQGVPVNFSKVFRQFFFYRIPLHDCFQHRFIHHFLSSLSYLSDDDPKTCEFNICSCDRHLASCLSKSKYSWKYWGYRFWPSNCESA